MRNWTSVLGVVVGILTGVEAGKAAEYDASLGTRMLLKDEITRHVVNECDFQNLCGKNLIDFDPYTVGVEMLPTIHAARRAEREGLINQIVPVVLPVRSFSTRALMYGAYYSVCIGTISVGEAEPRLLELVTMARDATLGAEDAIIARHYGTMDEAVRAVRDKNKVAVLEAFAGRLPDGYRRSIIQEYRHDIELWEWAPPPPSPSVKVADNLGSPPASTRRWPAPSDDRAAIAIVCVIAFLFVVLWVARKTSSKRPTRTASGPYDHPGDRGAYRPPPAPLMPTTPPRPRGPAPIDTARARERARRIGAIGEELEGWAAETLERLAETRPANRDLRDLQLKLKAIRRLALETEGRLSKIEGVTAARG